MAYNSAHTGPEIDAAVEMLGQVQSARDATAGDRSAVEALASQVAANASQVASQASAVSTKTAQVLTSATAVEEAHAEVLSASAVAVDSKDAAALSAGSAQESQALASAGALRASQSQLAAGLSEQISAENAEASSADRLVVGALAQQVEADRAASQISSDSAALSALNAAAVVTGGTATIAPAPGKIPLADAGGKINSDWLGADMARADSVAALKDPDNPSKGAALWGYKGRNGYEKLSDDMSIRDLITTAVDGTTSNQAGLEAVVSAAVAAGADIWWPAGTYVSTANIPGFHQVRHFGPGVLKRGSDTFIIQPKGKATTRNTLYVSTAGSDSNDGLSATAPFKTIQAAFDALTCFGPQLSGLWDVSVQGVVVGAGSMSGVLSRDFITIKGPSVVGQPTAEIDVTGLNAAYGMSFSGGMRVQTKDLLVRGARNGSGLASGIVLDAGTTGYHVNTWTRDCEHNGINANIRCRMLVQGGDYQADDTALRVYGESSAFIGYNNVRVAVRNAATGVVVSGSSYSHTDYVDFFTCTYGLVCDYQSHSTNYNNSFTNVNVGWEARNATINTLNPTINTAFSVARSRASFSMMGADNGNNKYNYAMQFHPYLGVNGRMGVGYDTWVQPFADFQYSKGGSTAGFSLSAFVPCTAVWESNTNTIIGLAAPDASFSAIWFGDSTSQRRSEIRASLGSLYVVQNNVTKFAFRTNDFVPFTDNNLAIGSASLRPSVLYAGTGTINTSDGRMKQQIAPIDDACLRAWAKVEYMQYKFNDAVEAKGDDARWHFGLIAQRVKEAFEAEGLDAFAYGVLCYDEWPEQLEIQDDEGSVMQAYVAAGNRYGIRYEEALALECAYLRTQLKK